MYEYTFIDGTEVTLEAPISDDLRAFLISIHGVQTAFRHFDIV